MTLRKEESYERQKKSHRDKRKKYNIQIDYKKIKISLIILFFVNKTIIY